MTPELSENLNDVEAVIGKTKNILARSGYPRDLRTVMVVAFIDQIIEHHEAMLLLIRNSKIGSAFALARSVIDGMYRGLWANSCATTAQLEKFRQDDILPVNMSEMADAIDCMYRGENGFFKDFKMRSWSALCSFTHTGTRQLGRRFTGQNLQPSYSDAEIVEATTSVTTCVLVLVRGFLAAQNRLHEAQETDALLGTYGRAVEQNAASRAS